MTEPDDRPEPSLFVQEWQQVIQWGMIGYTATCPDGEALGRKCDDPDCGVCYGTITVEPGSLDLGCGCGWHGSTDDGMTDVELHAAFAAHECPLRGVELSAEDMLAMVNDPGGQRRAHMAELANVVESGEIAVQSVFPTGDDSPWFAYTIGAAPDHGGEFMVRGFGEGTCGIVDAGIAWLRDGTIRLVPGVYQVGTDPGAFVRVDVWTGDPGDFGMAIRHYGHEDFARFHLVMADDEGRFPGDPLCECAEFQMLGL